MPTLFCTFTDATGRPCKGYVALTPAAMQNSNLHDGNAFGQKRVILPFDNTGGFSEAVEPGDYRVDICIHGAHTVSREVSIPTGSGAPVNLKDLLVDFSSIPSDVTSQFTDPGYYTYEIPWWATRIDEVLVGAGGGGDDGTLLTIGDGGGAGLWATRTLVRGVDIPWETTLITGTVGTGGAHNEGNGTSTTAAATGTTTLSAAGGIGGAAPTQTGLSPGNRTFNSVLYKGGGTQTIGGSTPGKSPGGGGAGGSALNGQAGAGADGAAWFRGYR